ncbi:PTS sugar transporter subunit IIA [Streptococcus zalophi]|uniref:PTS sugar transporter subunit IIA n=1 Tax=Streptococcus zalophi TaxID=640031 RepID=UPI00215CA345|nr:PTS sugar transporter subunit IIA [Streptococcus zalophi]MCR8966998.1 PTS sugar transporter subunit IIA [Streptococcus zalophi]
MQEELICLQVEEISESSEALKYLSQKLLKSGAVKENFCDAILDREKIFPTGLQFDGYGVAIPHTDSDYVNENKIAVMTLREPVTFTQMATSNQKVNVKLIIMLAIKNPQMQLDMLQKLIVLLQNANLVNQILSYQSHQKQEVVKLLSNYKIM